MKITDIALGTVSIPLITPFKTSLRTVDRIQDLVVRVTLDNGETGYAMRKYLTPLSADQEETPPDEPAAQDADSRIPPEARRMSASRRSSVMP